MKTMCGLAVFALLAGPVAAQTKIDETIAKAEEQYQKGKIEEAVKTLRKLASQNPASVETLLALGRMQERTGALAEAVASVAKAVEVAANGSLAVKAEALSCQSTMTLRRGAGKDALDQAMRAVETQATPAALAALARAQARVEQGADALAAAQRALQVAPRNACCLEAEGEALLALGRHEEAVAAYRKAIEADPQLIRARVGLAQALLAAGKASEAAHEAMQAKDKDANYGEAFAVLGEAIAAKNAADWTDAIAEAQQAVFLNDQSAVVQVSVGRLFDLDGNLDQAERAYGRALQIDPGLSAARLGLAQVEIRKGEVDAAEKELRQLASDQPWNGPAFGLLGRILLRKGVFDQAADALRKAAELHAGSAEGWVLLGAALQYSKQTAEAAAAYARAIDLDPANLEYRTTAGLLLGMNKQTGAAIDMLQRVIATTGYTGTDAWLNLGWVCRNANRTQDSVAAYRKVLEIDPKSAQAQLGIAWAYTAAKMWDDAIAAFAKAVEVDPALTGHAESTTAWCYYYKKDIKNARAHMERAKEAGREVSRLTAAVEKAEKVFAEGGKLEPLIDGTQGPVDKPDPIDISPVVKRLGSQKREERKRAVIDLVPVGCTAVAFLGYQLATDPDVAVRDAVLDGLTKLGCCARQELSKIDQFARSHYPPCAVDCTPEMVNREMQEGDLRRKAKALVEKLRHCTR